MGLKRYGRRLVERAGAVWFEGTVARLYRKYSDFTMVPRGAFGDNLRLCRSLRRSPGCVVECGVWRGGMSAAMVEILGPGRAYYLFDSFQGLPGKPTRTGLTTTTIAKRTAVLPRRQ